MDALERSASGACETIFVGGSVERAAEIRRRDRALRLRDQDTTYTHGANIRQPPVMPVVNVSSYEILDMPPELVRTIDAFYDSYAHLRKTEMESEESTGINQHVATRVVTRVGRGDAAAPTWMVRGFVWLYYVPRGGSAASTYYYSGRGRTGRQDDVGLVR